ncbi:MAG: tautomerase family protein [Candidatus Didemnitutus sp.]|nr:tautomerase family protein [Candidatus Didemnitutus sp.]
MPHIVVKLWPGKSEQQKQELAARITSDAMEVLDLGAETVSVAMEEIPSHEWAEKVYRPEIAKQSNKLYKKPGYSM